jgi:dodecin
MRHDWGMNGNGGDWRFQQYGRDDDRSRSREMERGGGRSRDEERGHGMRGEGMRGEGMRGEGMRGEGWGGGGMGGGGMNRERQMRGDDDLAMQRGEAPLVKVIEVVAQSPHSWEDAARRAVQEASRTLEDIKSIYIKDQQAIVSNGRIVEFRLVAKISFAINTRQRSSSGRQEHA